MGLKRFVLGLIAAITIAVPVHAGEFRISEDETVLYYLGGVAAGDARAMEQYILVYQPEKVVMTSNGGNASEGYALSSVLSQSQMTVEVPKGYMCMSACAVAFLGGGEKIIDGVLGFHIAYSRGDIPDGYGMKIGQQFGLLDAYLMIENGYNLLLARMTNELTSPSDFLVFTSEEELDIFRVNNPYNFAYDYIDLPEFFKDMEPEDFWKWFTERVYPPKELQDLQIKQRREMALGISGEEDRPDQHVEDMD